MNYLDVLKNGEVREFRDQNPEFVEEHTEKVLEIVMASAIDQLEILDANLSDVLDEVKETSRIAKDDLEDLRENGLDQDQQ